MKWVARLFLLALLGLPVAALAALWLCFQDAPLVAGKADISPADIERAKRILSRHDPRKAKPGTLRTIVATQQDVDLVLNYAATRLRRGSARVVLQPGLAVVQASLEAPPNPLGRWLNVDAALRETGSLPAFDRLRLGSLPVPGFVADFVLARLATRLNETAEGRLANDVLRSVKLAAGGCRWSTNGATIYPSAYARPCSRPGRRSVSVPTGSGSPG